MQDEITKKKIRGTWELHPMLIPYSHPVPLGIYLQWLAAVQGKWCIYRIVEAEIDPCDYSTMQLTKQWPPNWWYAEIEEP